jgi:hypothetical protein
MKWDKVTPPTQHTADKRYCIVQATEQIWIAYRMGPTTGEEIGAASDEEGARRVCERHETGNWL